MTGLMDSPPHVEVAAYILGALNKEDSEAFDRHLLDCVSCQNELREMYELPDALDALKRGLGGLGDPATTTNGAARGTANGAVSDPRADGVVTDLWSPQRRSRSSGPGHRRTSDSWGEPTREELAAARARRRRAMVLGVAAVLFIGVTGGVATSRLWPGANPVVAAGPTGAATTPDVREGTSPDTGVSGRVGLVARSWGTEVGFQLSGVTGPERCSLVAVARSGDTDIVSGWRVPPGGGFGVPGHPDPLRLTGATALARTDIVRFEVRRDDGVRLLEIPVA
ncbi:zf-HC2 domain-containing protein [Sphaerisporangium album]|uniref:Zf-HC2 domain-containing protein n=1 Tax=Sphaerisporangium album TaxID=509200 RepID=A0A367F3A8_9ACTN|nr:zf-HC2 domain-containing protein [Sphaerisporangium album]RCG23980.1 zf-HC2 domain-containing protein [Sphaerisporangium album]